LKSLREQYIALSKEVEDVMGSCWQTSKSLTRKSDQQSTQLPRTRLVQFDDGDCKFHFVHTRAIRRLVDLRLRAKRK
jgi:hypothetical protein